MNIEMLKIRIEKRIDTNYDIVQFRKRLLSYHAYDLANAFILMDKEYQHRIYEILSPEEFSKIFSYLELEAQIEISNDLYKVYFAHVIAHLPTDEACDLLKELDNRDEYFKLMPNNKAIILKSLIQYEDDQAGSMMSTEFIKISSEMDVKDAMKVLKENANSEVIDRLFVLEDGVLKGIVKLRDLIIARSPKKICEIMYDPIYVDSKDSVVNALELIKKYDLKALPVVEDGLMKGIISVDDWFDFTLEEAELDYNMMAGISFNDDDNGILKSMKKRLPWLLILMLLSLIVSTIISGFDRVIAEVSVLVVFQSLVLDMGGNCGTQSLAVAVRNLSSNKIESISSYLFKEFKIGFINGVVLGISSFLVSYIFLLIRHPESSIMISVIVGLAMMVTMIISTIMGALTPIVFNKMKVDPAVASGPFISTINDCLSVAIYYSLALLFIGMLR